MKIAKSGVAGLAIFGLLTGCGTDELASENANEEAEESAANAEKLKRKDWQDLSAKDDLEKPDYAPNVKDWIANTLEEFNRPPDQKRLDTGYDEGYDYYLKSMIVSNTVGAYIRVAGEDLEKDFENLGVLAGIISHEHYVRTAHIRPADYANKLDAVKDWKPVTKRMTLSFNYMKQLLNDLHVAINQNGEGKIYGVTHQLDGPKVKEMESFIQYDDKEIE